MNTSNTPSAARAATAARAKVPLRVERTSLFDATVGGVFFFEVRSGVVVGMGFPLLVVSHLVSTATQEPSSSMSQSSSPADPSLRVCTYLMKWPTTDLAGDGSSVGQVDREPSQPVT